MIVCSCNVFSDHDVRATLAGAREGAAHDLQVYHCLGCSAQCGRCARTIRRIMDEALATAEPALLPTRSVQLLNFPQHDEAAPHKVPSYLSLRKN